MLVALVEEKGVLKGQQLSGMLADDHGIVVEI